MVFTLQIMQGHGQVVGKDVTWAVVHFSKSSPSRAWRIDWKAGSRLCRGSKRGVVAPGVKTMRGDSVRGTIRTSQPHRCRSEGFRGPESGWT